MRKRNIRALVLKNIRYKDNDRIYTLFSRSEGKISAVAKGVTKISSRRAGSLDSFNEVEVMVSDHISGQIYINEAVIINSFQNIKHDYQKLTTAFYIAELINKLTMSDGDNEHIYDLIIMLFKKLNQIDYLFDSVLINKFEFKLMQLLGYEPPKIILLSWKSKVSNKNYKEADIVVKKFVKDIVGENLKSLEL